MHAGREPGSEACSKGVTCMVLNERAGRLTLAPIELDHGDELHLTLANGAVHREMSDALGSSIHGPSVRLVYREVGPRSAPPAVAVLNWIAWARTTSPIS